MTVLAVVSQKGGVGKSQCVRSLAVAALIDGRKAAIVDADPQGTIVAWGKRRQQPVPGIFPVAEMSISKAVAEAKRRGAEFVVIDTPPSTQPIINSAAGAADSCLIVTGVGIEDLEAIAPTAQIARALKKPAAIILNKTSRNATLNLAKAALGTFRIPVCPITISQLVAHQYAASSGETAQEYDSSSKAAQEIEQAYQWLKSQGIV